MLRRCTLLSKREDDVWTIAAEKEDYLPNESIWIDLLQNTVSMSWRRERGNAEEPARRCKLKSPACSQFGTRRKGDAGTFPGIPVSRTEEIDPITGCGELRDRPAGRERFVVRMGEYAPESPHR
jgi:hypothetical protein